MEHSKKLDVRNTFSFSKLVFLFFNFVQRYQVNLSLYSFDYAEQPGIKIIKLLTYNY